MERYSYLLFACMVNAVPPYSSLAIKIWSLQKPTRKRRRLLKVLYVHIDYVHIVFHYVLANVCYERSEGNPTCSCFCSTVERPTADEFVATVDHKSCKVSKIAAILFAYPDVINTQESRVRSRHTF